MRLFALALLPAIALAYLLSSGPLVGRLGLAQGDTSTHSPRYLTAPIEEGEIRRTITATGTLNAILNVEVGSQLSGQVAQLFADFNDEVHKGQPLAKLDQRTFQARVDEARAAVQVAEVAVSGATARLERARIDALDAEAQLPVLKARTDAAVVKLDAARNELRRKEMLRERQTSTVVELEDAKTKVAAAEAALRESQAIAAAQANKIEGAKTDIQRFQSELDTAKATLPQKQALLDVAEIDLDRTTIRSPIDGIVVGRNVNEGQTLATTLEAKTLFILAGDLHRMEMHAKVDEADIGQIRVGQGVSFTVDAYPGRQFLGTVRQLRKAPQVVQNVVTYAVVISAANDDGVLLPGMTALASISVSRTGPVKKVPLAALRYSPGSGREAKGGEEVRGKPGVVWVLGEDGEPRPISVGIGGDDGNYAELVSGALDPGDRVIVGDAIVAAPRKLFGIRIGF